MSYYLKKRWIIAISFNKVPSQDTGVLKIMKNGTTSGTFHKSVVFIVILSICYLFGYRPHNLKAAGSNPAPATNLNI